MPGWLTAELRWEFRSPVNFSGIRMSLTAIWNEEDKTRYMIDPLFADIAV